MTWLQTSKGRVFDLLDPRADMVDFAEIAFALARLNRFTGHAGVYSVAQHCAHGCDYFLSLGDREGALFFLLHDAHEAYIGDLSTPLKMALAASMPAFPLHWKMLRKSIDAAIWRASGLLPPSPEIAARVKLVDLAMLRTERDQLLTPPPAPWMDAVEQATPLPVWIDRLTAPELAERRWLGRFRSLTQKAEGATA